MTADVHLPANLDAEEQVLGAILARGAMLGETAVLAPEDFYIEKHARLFDVLKGMAARGEATDVISVNANLNGTGGLWVRDLAAGALAIPAATPQHVALVQEAAERRRAIFAAQRVIESGGDLGPIRSLVEVMRSSDPTRSRLLDGIAFAEAADNAGPALWGEGRRVLWSPGEPLMFYGPQGVGKTTLGQRLTLARSGVHTELLGLPVEPSERKVLYVAADRPMQASRSWRRMISTLDPDEREHVRERVLFWRGPLPFDLGREPERLVPFLDQHGVGTFVGDSLKDLAADLVKDEVGARVNHAWQSCVSAGIEPVDLHHNRKTPAGMVEKPRSLNDCYGSSWLTAGHGSVVMLWGKPGDPIVELSHLKQPIEEVGPLRVMIDHEAGEVAIHDGGDVLAILRSGNGMGVADVARFLFTTTKPTDSEVEKARRRLDGLAATGLAYKRPSDEPTRGGKVPAVYFATPPGGSQTEIEAP